MTHHASLDSIEAVTEQYRAMLLHHHAHHAGKTVANTLLFPDHGIDDNSYNIRAHLSKHLGTDLQGARHIYYTDMADQLNKIRAATFTRDHLVYSGAGFPEQAALNPAGKPSLIAQTHLVKEMASLLEPRAEGPLGFADTVLRDRQIGALATALSDLRDRYKNALANLPEHTPQVRRELLTYSYDLVEHMQHVARETFHIGNERSV